MSWDHSRLQTRNENTAETGCLQSAGILTNESAVFPHLAEIEHQLYTRLWCSDNMSGKCLLCHRISLLFFVVQFLKLPVPPQYLAWAKMICRVQDSSSFRSHTHTHTHTHTRARSRTRTCLHYTCTVIPEIRSSFLCICFIYIAQKSTQ